MTTYKVKKGEALLLDEKQEIEITSYIVRIVKEINLTVLAYNICCDHVHILLICEEENLPNIIRKLKGKSTQLYKKNNNITDEFSLWAQKYNISYLELNDSKFINTINYIDNNREKHKLPNNNNLKIIVQDMVRI